MSGQLYQLPLLQHLRQVWRRRQRLAWLALTVPLTAAIGLAWFLPRHYRATALVVVERGTGADDDEIDARLAFLKNENLQRSRLRGLISGYNLYPELGRHTSAEVLIDRMLKDIRIDVDKEERGGHSAAVAVHVAYTAQDPRVAAEIANELADFYEREDLRIREQRATYQIERLKSQLADARESLDEQAKRLKDYKIAHLNQLPEQVGLHLAALEQLNSQIRASQGDAHPGRAHTAGGALSPTGADIDPRLAQLHELEARFTPEHPDVKRLKREIAMMPFASKKPSPEAQPGTISIADAEAANESETKARVEGIQHRIEGLRQAAATHEQDILNAPARQQELEALLPDYTAARTRYQTLSEKYEIAQLADPRHDGGGLRVLDRAVARAQAIAPNVPRILAIGLALSLAAAFAVVAAAERMDTSFHTLSDLRTFTRVPVLASLPRLASSNEQRRAARGKRDFAAVLVLIVACILIAAALLSRGTPILVG